MTSGRNERCQATRDFAFGVVVVSLLAVGAVVLFLSMGGCAASPVSSRVETEAPVVGLTVPQLAAAIRNLTPIEIAGLLNDAGFAKRWAWPAPPDGAPVAGYHVRAFFDVSDTTFQYWGQWACPPESLMVQAFGFDGLVGPWSPVGRCTD